MPSSRRLRCTGSSTTSGRGRGSRRRCGRIGVLEIQCGGEGNIARVREVIDAVAREGFDELVGWSPWTFASPVQTERRMRDAGFMAIRCWLQERPTDPDHLGTFVRTSILPAHLARLPEDRRDTFAAAVVSRVTPPRDYVRLNVSARGRDG